MSDRDTTRAAEIGPTSAPILNRLCYTIALTKAGKVNTAVDSLVVSVLAIDGMAPPASAVELVKVLHEHFHISLHRHLVQAALDRLQNVGKVRFERQPTPRYQILASARQEVDAIMADATALEEAVKGEWLESLAPGLKPQSQTQEEELWTCLRSFLAKAFLRHGAETALLLKPVARARYQIGQPLSDLLDESIAQACGECSYDQARDAVAAFFQESSEKQTKYLAQVFDGGFTLFALSADAATSEYLRSQLRRTSLILDTNFILGLLGIKQNMFQETARDVVDLIAENSLPFRLYYHETTLDELSRTLHGQGTDIRGAEWQPAVSRVALRQSGISGLAFLYHRQNAASPISAEDFLAKFDHLEELLKDLGITQLRDPVGSTGAIDRKGELIAEYDEFLQRNRKRGSKPQAALAHDITLWQAAQRLRGTATSLLDAGALILTADYHFYLYDWQDLREPRKLGTVILANQLIQVLRPFIPRTIDADRHFVESFALPQIRTAESGYEQVTSRALRILNTYSDISEQAAERILAGVLLKEHVHKPDLSLDQLQRIVDASVEAELEALQMANADLTDEVSQLRSDNAALAVTTGASRSLVNRGVAIGVLAASVLIVLIWLLPPAVRFETLEGRGDAWYLKLTASVVVSGAAWAVVDRAHWRDIVIGVVVVAILALAVGMTAVH